MSARAATFWTFVITSVAVFMAVARQPGRDHRPARHPAGPRRHAGGARVDGQRLHADLRRAPADRRRARRPLRAQAHVPRRPRRLHRRLRRRGAGAEHRRADRRPGRPGRRRRDRDAAHASRSCSAAVPPARRGIALGIWGGVSGLAVAIGPLVGGAIVEGLSWQWIFWLNVPIGLALLPLARLRLTESTGPNERARPPRHSSWPAPACSASSGAWSAATSTAGPATASPGRSSPASSLLGAFIVWERRTPEPMLPLRLLPHPRLHGRQRRLAAHVLRDVRLDLPARPVLPGRAGLHPARGRLRTLPVDGHADHRRADRRRSPRPDRRPPAARRRPRPAGHRAGVVRHRHHPDRRRTCELVPRSCWPGSAWACTSPRSPTWSSPRSVPRRRARRPAPTTPSARSVACSGSRCWRPCSRGAVPEPRSRSWTA